MAATFPQFRTLLILGRISNLPTVWSNCLAAWLLNGGGSWNNFCALGLATTFLYIGGMFLNDAFDAGFDREFRKERPIPSGQISERAVWWLGGIFLLIGWMLMLLLGLSVALDTLILIGVIVYYDAVHKKTVFAPLIMASCRFLLYLVAAAATLRAINDEVIGHGLALAAYVTGLSCLARSELGQKARFAWPLLLLVAPLMATLKFNTLRSEMSWCVSAFLVAWIIWCLLKVARFPGRIGDGVSGLLAGIVLVDWAAVPSIPTELNLGFVSLFVLALILQRKIPAT